MSEHSHILIIPIPYNRNIFPVGLRVGASIALMNSQDGSEIAFTFTGYGREHNQSGLCAREVRKRNYIQRTQPDVLTGQRTINCAFDQAVVDGTVYDLRKSACPPSVSGLVKLAS